MGQIKLYGRRTVSQFTSGNPTAAQYSHISVYNDSTIGHILRVRSYSVAPGAGAYVLGFLNQGSLGTLVAAGIPIFAGEGRWQARSTQGRIRPSLRPASYSANSLQAQSTHRLSTCLPASGLVMGYAVPHRQHSHERLNLVG